MAGSQTIIEQRFEYIKADEGERSGNLRETEVLRLPQTAGLGQAGLPPRALVALAALLFSTGGAAIKTGAFGALQVSSARSGIAALALLLFVRGRVHLSRAILLTAVAYAACLTLFVAATKLTTAANAIFLQSTAPVYLLAAGPWILREPFRRRDLPYALVMVAGLGLCFFGQPPASNTAPNPFAGNLLALASSVSWAAVILGLRYAAVHGERDAALSSVIAGNALASLAVLPFAWPFPPAPALAWSGLVYLGVVQIGLAYVCLTRAMGHIRAVDVSLLLLLEPVLNPVWTWLVRGEAPGIWALVGGALIVGAVGGKSGS